MEGGGPNGEPTGRGGPGVTTGGPRLTTVARDATPGELRELESEYEILAELGRGGMAVVYLARDRQLGREVAIKVIHAAAGADESAIARLLSEARTVAQLQHPNVVTIHAVKRLSTHGLALVMQYVPGRSLERAMREDGAFDPDRAESVLTDIAAALAYAHARGVVHRDVKPDNIFLNDETGRALLSDFGIALSAEMGRQEPSADLIVGTPAYMSPEQIDGAVLDGRSDLYSLGVVGYEMLAGVRAWIDETPSDVMYRQKFEPLPPLAPLRPDISDRLVGVIERALAKDRDERWPSAAAFLNGLTEDEWTPTVRPTPAVGGRAVGPGAPPGPAHSPLPSAPVYDAVQTKLYRREASSVITPQSGELSPLWSTPERPTHRMGLIVAVAVAIALVAVAAFTPRGLLEYYIPALAVSHGDSALRDSVAGASVAARHGVPESTAAAAPPLDTSATRELAIVRDSLAHVDSVAAAAKPPTAPPHPVPVPAAHTTASTTAGPPPASTGPSPKPAPTPPPQTVAQPTAPPPSAPPAAGPPPTGPPPGATGLRAPIHPPGAPSVVAGGTHTCALSADGTASCWGGNDRGQLGTGGGARAGAPTRVPGTTAFEQISAGLTHTCGVTRGGAVYCWGANDYGQLGDSTLATHLTPERTALGHSYRLVESGTSHTCGLTVGGDVYCWGRNLYGQLGNGSVGDAASPVRVVSSTPFVALSVGWNHSCALDVTGDAYCWGQNATGQLGDGTTNVRTAPAAVTGGDAMVFRAIAAGGSHTCALTPDGQAYCWGRNNYGQLGTGDAQDHAMPTKVQSPVPFIAITAGGVHTCGITRAGEAYCWGRNSYGQVGDGTMSDRPAPVAVKGGQVFTSIHASGSHTCGRASTGGMYCWGYNSDGQLGDGTTTHRSAPVLVPASGS